VKTSGEGVTPPAKNPRAPQGRASLPEIRPHLEGMLRLTHPTDVRGWPLAVASHPVVVGLVAERGDRTLRGAWKLAPLPQSQLGGGRTFHAERSTSAGKMKATGKILAGAPLATTRMKAPLRRTMRPSLRRVPESVWGMLQMMRSLLPLTASGLGLAVVSVCELPRICPRVIDKATVSGLAEHDRVGVCEGNVRNR